MFTEMQAVCQYAAEKNIAIESVPSHVMGNNREKTNQRKLNEVKLRLQQLDYEERLLLRSNSALLAKQVALLACIRSYSFIADFFWHVIVTKAAVYDYSITERDYNSFFNKQSLEHPEIDQLAPSTKKKIKQVLFRMLYEAEFTNSTKKIQFSPHYLDNGLKKVLQAKQKNKEIKSLLG